jgi:hypothetical protein
MRAAVLAVLALPALHHAAEAAPSVVYNLEGLITEVGTRTLVPVSPGQVIPIAIEVNLAYPATPPGSGQYTDIGNYDPANPIGDLILSGRFGAESSDGLIQSIALTSSSITFSTAGPQVGSGFRLGLSGAQPGTLVIDALPATLDPGLFTSGTFSVTEAFSPTIIGYSGVIIGLGASVPEPASALTCLASLLGLFALACTSIARGCLIRTRSPHR